MLVITVPQHPNPTHIYVLIITKKLINGEIVG